MKIPLNNNFRALARGLMAVAFTATAFCSINARAQNNNDLGVAYYGPYIEPITNDWIHTTVSITNYGPYTVTNVQLTVVFPSCQFVDVTPTGGSVNPSSHYLAYSFTSLTNGEVRNLFVRVQPTNTGSITLAANIVAVGNSDPNAVNDSSYAPITVRTYLSGSVVASIASAQFNDPQVGLEEQWIQVSNAGPSIVQSARIVVTGLTNFLWNYSGTNNGNPFVIYPLKLNPREVGSFLLQFYPNRTAFPFSNSQMHAFETVMPALTPPGNARAPIPVGSMVTESASAKLPGATLITWACPTNQSYAILYSDNPEFANALISPALAPATGANVLFWVDYGPPATISFPTNTSPRYYRVYQFPK
jgi:hypothetical protein